MIRTPIIVLVGCTTASQAFAQETGCLTQVDRLAIPGLIAQEDLGAYHPPQGGLAGVETTIRIKWHVITSTSGQRSISATRH